MVQIVESNEVSFETYRNLVEKYTEKDWREVNFQNEVVKKFLEKLLVGEEAISVVDVSMQHKNRESACHTRKPYAAHYTPDLLIVRNWNYSNIGSLPQDYLAVVEVKSPILAPLCSPKEHTSEEVQAYLANGNRVILTDCYQWVFYGFEPAPRTFTLRDAQGWVMKTAKNPAFWATLGLEFEASRLESRDWRALTTYLCKGLLSPWMP